MTRAEYERLSIRERNKILEKTDIYMSPEGHHYKGGSSFAIPVSEVVDELNRLATEAEQEGKEGA